MHKLRVKIHRTASDVPASLDFQAVEFIVQVGETGASIVKVFIQTPVVSRVLKLVFISSSSPLVALERDIFKLTKFCLMSEKIEMCKTRCKT